MKIWGYVLIVLNLGATAAFLYFGVQLWKARTEWQYALLKQELVNRGLPLDASAKPPEDLDENQVAFDFRFGVNHLEAIDKRQLAKLIPSGGEPLGAKGGIVVTNQTDEVKRVDKIIFAELDALKPPQKRGRVLVLLLNLAKGMGREGAYALLRDFPDDRRRTVARRELAFLGRSAPQVATLLAVNGVGVAQTAFEPNVSPEDRAKRIRAGRAALVGWAYGEVPQAAPPAKPTGDGSDDGKAERDRLIEVLNIIKTEMEAPQPNIATLDATRQRLLGLLEGDDAIRGAQAAALIPFIAQIATNPLDSEEKITAAKDKLQELLLLRATTDAEKKSLTATVELMTMPIAEGAAGGREKMNTLIDTASVELLRSYFEEAEAKPSDNGLPAETAQARAALAALRPVRDPAKKQADIAHLLYHLDANLVSGKAASDQLFSIFLPDGFKSDDSALPKSAAPPAAEGGPRTEWHKRVVAVVGLENYVPVVEAQATELNEIYQRLRSRLLEEQNLFQSEYQHEVLEAIVLANDLDIREAAVKTQKLNVDDHTRQLTVREAEKKELEDKLAQVTAAAKEALSKLDGRVSELFQITKQLGEAQDALVELEHRLNELELGPVVKKKQ